MNNLSQKVPGKNWFMNLNAKEFEYWNAYVATLTETPLHPTVTADVAGNDTIADDLLALYLNGTKTAGAALVKQYEAENADLPQVGNYWIILDSKKIHAALSKQFGSNTMCLPKSQNM